MEAGPIPTYVINLKNRTDRKEHILNEFSGRNEFQLEIIQAHEHPVGSVGLWHSIIEIVGLAKQRNQDLILICEDDHEFTANYSSQHLFDCIAQGAARKIDVLIGGVSTVQSAVSITKSLFWIESFNGTQFIIFYKDFFEKLLKADFEDYDIADLKIVSLTKKRLLIYPFISVQKEFGYSDVTFNNNKIGRVTQLFENASKTINCLQKVESFYKRRQSCTINVGAQENHEEIFIPTYIINLPERTERREHIQKQFQGKNEFDVTIVEACKHKIGAVGLWLSICKIVKMATEKQDDVIIICEDDHEFTECYNKWELLRNIFESHEQNAAILSGGIGGYTHTNPINESKMWVSFFLSTQFIVIYKKLFKKILKYKFKKNDAADMVLANMTSHKMVLHPFISRQKDFGYSDVTPIHNAIPGLVQDMFKNTEERLEDIKAVAMKFSI